MRHTLAFYLGRIGIALAILLVIGYAYYRTRDYFTGPIVTITSPISGMATTTHVVVVTGTVKNSVAVTMNDRKIFLDENGMYAEKLLLPDGYTIIEVKAEDRFNRSTKKRLEIIVKD